MSPEEVRGCTSVITEAHLDQAITWAEAGGNGEHAYDQSSWCGTACCVLGFARLAAGVKEVNMGPRSGEIENTPRAETISRLMSCSSKDILRVMSTVQPDGTINLHGADLTCANLTSANLRGAVLTDANLRGADLIGADLTGANLIGADLTDANLTGANLTSANLIGADLTGADLTGAVLRGAVLPDGRTRVPGQEG